MHAKEKNTQTKLLIEILEELRSISSKLDVMNQRFRNINSEEETTDKDIPTSIDIINLQETRPGIFKTYKFLQKTGKWITSKELAKLTGRTRGLESRYLNWLYEEGIILKKRSKVEEEGKATEVFYKIKTVEND